MKEHYCCCESYFSLVHLFLYQTLRQAKILICILGNSPIPSFFPIFPIVGWTQCPYLSRSGWRLSVRHFSCSSPSLILSSSSRCSMMRADFIFTKCSQSAKFSSLKQFARMSKTMRSRRSRFSFSSFASSCCWVSSFCLSTNVRLGEKKNSLKFTGLTRLRQQLHCSNLKSVFSTETFLNIQKGGKRMVIKIQTNKMHKQTDKKCSKSMKDAPSLSTGLKSITSKTPLLFNSSKQLYTIQLSLKNSSSD